MQFFNEDYNVNVTNTNSARVGWGDQYNLHKKEKQCLLVCYYLSDYWQNI